MNQTLFKNLGKFLTKNSPTILTGLSVAGLVSTVVMAVRATPKALQILDNERGNREIQGIEEDRPVTFEISPKDVILLTWKTYLPTAIMGATTIICIVGANSINLRRNAALAGLYSLTETALKEYKSKVIETIGENKERTIRDEVAKDRIHKNPPNDNEVIMTGYGETLCYDVLSGRYFKSDREKINRAINEVTRDMMTDTTMTLNELYDRLGLKNTKMGDMVGWHIDDGVIEPDFSSQLTENGIPCLVLDFKDDLRYLYRD